MYAIDSFRFFRCLFQNCQIGVARDAYSKIEKCGGENEMKKNTSNEGKLIFIYFPTPNSLSL